MHLLQFDCHCFNGGLNSENISIYKKETGSKLFTRLLTLVSQIGNST